MINNHAHPPNSRKPCAQNKPLQKCSALLVCMMVVFSSAFKLPASLSRRDMAKAIAAAPLAALAAPAFADNQIVMYGTAKGTDLGKGMIEMCKQSALPPPPPRCPPF